MTDRLTVRLNDLHVRLVDEYVTRNPASKDRFERASQHMPGGNTRSVLHFDPFPIGVRSGRDCFVTSLDGDEYLDFVSEYSAAMFGHSNPIILKAIQDSLRNGINLGGPGEAEVELAAHIRSRFPSMEKLRFCNSGSEANTMALALAINATKRRKIIAFRNGYHGGFITFSDAPSAATIPHDFVLAQFNDIDSVRAIISEDVAAILVEPMQGAGGAILGTRPFLQYLRDAATQHGALLIFDEVVTSRLDMHGLQGYYGVHPDITTLGKYVGGGPSFGAFGGRADLMEMFNPQRGLVAHSGTYNNNVFTMAAGNAAAKILTQDKIEKANRLGDKLRDAINVCESEHIKSTGFGSVIGLSFSGPAAAQVRETFFFYMLGKRVYIGKRGFLSVNLAHEEEHIERFLEAFHGFLKEISEPSRYSALKL